MKSPSRQAGKLSAREVCVLALMAALMFGTKLAMAALPNININAPIIILTTVFFGWKALYTVGIYIMLEGLTFGFGLWWLSYWYLWPTLVLIAMLLRKNGSALIWAVTAAVFGLCFGLLCSIPYLFVGGWELAFSYWISGLPFDFSHCAGNFCLTLVLFKPLHSLMEKLLRQ